MNTCIIEVLFKVEAKLRLGEEVRVSGNVPALGCDDRERAVRLVTTGSDYPLWNTREALYLPGNNNEVTYRYCVYSGGKFLRWEGDFIRPLVVEESESNVKTTNDLFGQKVNTKSLASSAKTRSDILTKSEIRSFRTRQFMEWNRKVQVDNNISSHDGVVVAAYFLPVIVTKSADGVWSATWDTENILSLRTNLRVSWVGSVRYPGGIPSEEEEAVAAVLAELNCYPVFIPYNMKYTFYDVFCKQVLWPVLHHIADVYGAQTVHENRAHITDDLWFSYTTVTRYFRDKVVEVYQHGDLVWIHGFHLMLLPSFLRRLIPLAKIGIFFHTPFPSSEIWRTMRHREDLLRGMLSADHIGFHLYEYARHFLTTCRRLMGFGYEMNAAGTLSITVDGRDVAVTCMHVGVDLPSVESALASHDFENGALAWKKKFPGKIIFSGIDRLERLKGVPLKLLGIEQFLENYPEYKHRVVFPIIGVSAKERGDDYTQTLSDVNLLVNRINKTHSTNGEPVVYFEERSDGDLSLPERLSFFAASDVLLNTAVRDGLNRMPMEFTLARVAFGRYIEKRGLPYEQLQGTGLPSQGLIIISEFVSSARVMRGGLTINPWSDQGIPIAILRTLIMNPIERADRMRRNVEFSTRLTTANWATHVLHDLKCVVKSEDHTEYSAFGLGMGFRMMGVKSGFQTVDTKSVCLAYREARKRLVLLDWGGTLVLEETKTDNMAAYAHAQGLESRGGPSEQVLSTISSLCADPKNCVFVISGKDILSVSEYFGEVEGLGLGAEHGFYYRWPAKGEASNCVRWQQMVTGPEAANQPWKEPAKMVMDVFVQRTHGTYIESKGNALIWQYRDADPEFGYLQSKEIEEHLTGVLAGYAVEIIRGGSVSDGYIEVRPSGVSKGLFLKHALGTLKTVSNNGSSDNKVEFVLAVGDDASDEPMFEQLNNLVASSSDKFKAFGVTVGKKPTAAMSYVDDPAAVLELLSALIKSSQRDKRYFSSVDLAAQLDKTSSLTSAGGGDSAANGARTTTKAAVPLVRAASDGDLTRANPEGLREFNPALATQDGRMACVPSSKVDISMSQYLTSINEQGNDDEEDDGGIYF